MMRFLNEVAPFADFVRTLAILAFLLYELHKSFYSDVKKFLIFSPYTLRSVIIDTPRFLQVFCSRASGDMIFFYER